MLTLISRTVGASRILLLDLVWTLAVRPGGERRGNYAKVITDTETYRLGLIRQIQADGFFVVMLTARSVRYREVTLANLARHSDGWQPDVAIFNEDDAEAPVWKSTALHRYIFPEFGQQRSRYFALEANRLTRAMYAGEGIEVQTWETYLQNAHQRSFDW